MTADGFAGALGSGEEEYVAATGVEARIIEALIWGVPGETEPERQKYARGLLETFAAARERAAAEKARADERERIALAIEAAGRTVLPHLTETNSVRINMQRNYFEAARIARSQP